MSPRVACEKCDGVGWLQVTAHWVESTVPEPEMPEDEGPEWDALRAELVRQFAYNRAAAENTWYPCRECNRRAFFRFIGGHWSPDHDRTNCDECETPGRRRSSHRRRSSSEADEAPAESEPF